MKIIKLVIIICLFSLVIGCYNGYNRYEDEKEVNNLQDETKLTDSFNDENEVNNLQDEKKLTDSSNDVKEVNSLQDEKKLKEGFILTAKVFIPEGTYLEKDKIDQTGMHTEKMYVKNDKARTDTIYSDNEQRVYTLAEGETITVQACVKKETWTCNLDTSMKKWQYNPYSQELDEETLNKLKRLQDTRALQELDEETLNKLKKLPDKTIVGLHAKCFEDSKKKYSVCYHPDYQITLYKTRKDGFTWEATELEFTIPEDDLFVLPI